MSISENVDKAAVDISGFHCIIIHHSFKENFIKGSPNVQLT